MDRSAKADERHSEDVGEIDSHLLLGRCGRILIRHNGQRYELRETRFGKLILTK
ncbi:MAG: hemin uptake protein HemP [Wenzhouxiangella sp.]|jgi:hemin uptake protein HemP|nr:hemin uptake protein HemP [Wenzhouxiangella sp.]